MTSDSVPLPPWSEVQDRLDAAQRRRDEQRKELLRINLLRGAGVAMMGIGFVAGAVLVAATASNHEVDQIRHLFNPYTTMLTLGGLILLGIGTSRAAGCRDRETIIGRLAKMERRQRSEGNHLGWPQNDSDREDKQADESKHDNEGGAVNGSVIAMPNKKIYELGINEGLRRARETRREDPKT